MRRSLKELQALALAGAKAGGEPLQAPQAGAKAAAAQKTPPAGKAAAKVDHLQQCAACMAQDVLEQIQACSSVCVVPWLSGLASAYATKHPEQP